MKKLTFSFILLFASLNLFSQKLVSNKMDEFDNVRRMLTTEKKITGNPLSIIQFETIDNLVYINWFSRYVTLFTTRGKKMYLLDDSGKKYTFYCIAESNYNNTHTRFKYVGDFNAIENKRIVKYRIETIDGAVDYDIDKSKTEIIAQQYRFIKSEVEKYFPNGVLDTKDAMDVLNNKFEMKDILDALNRLSE